MEIQETKSEPGICVAEYYLEISGVRIYGRGMIDSAPRSCCGLHKKTPLNFLLTAMEEVEQCAHRRATRGEQFSQICSKVDTLLKPEDHPPVAANGYAPETFQCTVGRGAGNSGTSGTVSVSADNAVSEPTPPTVTITSPTDGARVRKRRVNIKLNASDDVQVQSVEVYVDGRLIGSASCADFCTVGRLRTMVKSLRSICISTVPS